MAFRRLIAKKLYLSVRLIVEKQRRNKFVMLNWLESIACSLGFTPFAPHLLYPQFLDNSIREERDTGINCGLDILQLCSELWICGTKVTDGMKREIQFAKLCDIPVKEVQIDLDIM